jgi:putative hydrolase of HD superfamily
MPARHKFWIAMTDTTHPPDVTAAARGLLALARRSEALKALPRTGWLDHGIPPPLAESVADHTFGVALLAWLSAVERQAAGVALDPCRVLQLALVHDLSEAETGDITPYDQDALSHEADADARRAFLERRHVRDPSREAKKRAAEDGAMHTLLAALPPAARDALGLVWEELRSASTPEARFVKQVDRLETFLQSRRYQRDDPSLPVDSFRQEVEETIDDPLLAAVRDAALEAEQTERG